MTVDNSSQKIIIPKKRIYDTYALFDINYSDGSEAAIMAWVGKSSISGDHILQPAIITRNKETSYLSYDGQANFIEGHNQIILPSDGSLFKIEQNVNYYFNNDNPRLPENGYALQYNNKSIRMNNISIFNADFSKGVMLDFRASLEGTLSDPEKNGFVIVLASIDQIN